MHSGEGSFAAPPAAATRIQHLPERRFAVRAHGGTMESIEETRRPLYQHMIMHELVGGPPVLRFGADDGGIDVLVGATCGFDGDTEVAVEVLPAGWHAIHDYEGPAEGLPAAREALFAWAAKEGHQVTGPLLQVHMMDPIDGDVEQQLQLPIAPPKSVPNP